MRGCARAPVRVDPAGGGTDAPPFCIEHGGAVVNFAIQRHAFASAQRLKASSGIILYAMDLKVGVVVKSVSELGRDSDFEFIKAFVKRLVPDGDSLLLVTETDVPAGSGLGGSGALGVAIVAAIDRAYDRNHSPLETAALANEIERKDLGYPGGDQDSLGAALGGINFLEYHQGGGMTPHKISVSPDTLRSLEHGSLLIYSGAAHVSGSIHEDIKHSYGLKNSPTVEAMIKLREQAQAMAQSLEEGNLVGYASALSESCRQLYNLHESCDSADHRRYFQALDDCILGGKTCGAGGGGFLLVYVKPGRRQECIHRIEELDGLVWPVTIDFEGVTQWLTAQFDDAEVQRFRHLADLSA
jgi:D-glycero-alpha-D-manno-heptose-7-phosphate kinase